MTRFPCTMLRAVAVATMAFAAVPSFAQGLSCAGIAERHEEASTRLMMIEARQALLQQLERRSTPAEVFVRLDNEIAALSTMDDGTALDDVAQRYRACRFDLFTVTSLPQRGPTVVVSRCPPGIGRSWALNDALETLHGVAQQGDNASVLQSMLQDRNDRIDDLLVCEQEICRSAWLKKQDRPVAAADYLAAHAFAPDPQAWARGPIVVQTLHDYLVPHTPVGVYPLR